MKNNYNKVAGYMVNIQKSITFMYTNNEQVEFEIKSTILFILAPKKKIKIESNKICALSI